MDGPSMKDGAIESRLPGWYLLDPGARAVMLAELIGMPLEELSIALSGGGLDVDAASKLVENVIGTFGLPFAVATNFRINGADFLIPMVIEEPSVVAASSKAALMVRKGGGFKVRVDDPLMIGQIQVFTGDREGARRRILESSAGILELAARTDETLAALGGGPVGIEVRDVSGDERGEGFLVVHLIVDVRDAMGANTVNSMAEAVSPELERITGGRTGLRILSNLADRRRVKVEAHVPAKALAVDGFEEEDVLDGIVSASRFAELDPYRAATHNKGVMNGTDAVLLATGNDWRAVEAGAHAFAARNGRYEPLCVWRRDGDALSGFLDMPMAVGTVGGATRLHPTARLAIGIIGSRKASDLAAAAAAAGMANNLAALRALATEGIQKGHMRLHSRSRVLEK